MEVDKTTNEGSHIFSQKWAKNTLHTGESHAKHVIYSQALFRSSYSSQALKFSNLATYQQTFPNSMTSNDNFFRDVQMTVYTLTLLVLSQKMLKGPALLRKNKSTFVPRQQEAQNFR